MKKQDRHAQILSLLADSKTDDLVSPRTLSLALNISEVTVRRDLQALAEAALIYRQHGGVRLPRPALAQTQPVGILIVALRGKFSHPFHNAQLEGADRALQALGYHVAFVKTFTEVDSEEAVRELLDQHPIKGLIIIGGLDLERQNRWTTRVAAVVTTSLPRTSDVSVILCDGFGGIEKLFAYLIGLEKRRIAFVMGTDPRGQTDDRFVAYRQCIQRYRLDDDPALCFEMQQPLARDPAKVGREGASVLMSLAHPPDVLMCMSDMIAIGAMQWLQTNGFRVPEDVAVTGFDNLAESELTFPALTTVHVHKRLMGQLAAEQLHRRILYPSEPSLQILTPTSLVVRRSCEP